MRIRRRVVALVVAAVLAVAGIVLVATAVLGQGPPPEPAAAAPLPAPAPEVIVKGSGELPVPVGAILPASQPAAIAIPSIGVRSPVNQVGLAPDGSLEVPAPGPLYDQAAWYRSSAMPGTVGPAIILGHVDSAANGPSVFFELGRMKPGQDIDVTRADGSVARFRVDSVQSFPKNEFPTRSVYANTDRAELRLITCGGSFDSAAGSYRDNTVVFAHLV